MGSRETGRHIKEYGDLGYFVRYVVRINAYFLIGLAVSLGKTDCGFPANAYGSLFYPAGNTDIQVDGGLFIRGCILQVFDTQGYLSVIRIIGILNQCKGCAAGSSISERLAPYIPIQSVSWETV